VTQINQERHQHQNSVKEVIMEVHYSKMMKIQIEVLLLLIQHKPICLNLCLLQTYLSRFIGRMEEPKGQEQEQEVDLLLEIHYSHYRKKLKKKREE